ncbi:Protein CBG11068 [Caenorhabditis briggsae]|uniref:Uncharacterized protein n=2 Tax=Caenorhabditis briggsae TaxID=6238 RepID=A0AAE9DHK1_CAEBR|nr:Protein CBG11068 [Caenorhabditis briggsae]ULU04738.1 hypothetical protein L3Y34_017476 [Caenorhabditis briggsae]UMM16727.1 hypothetical protein L5515_013616 [Caenorhabditis briggsae]CAP30287.1 Protein CBG11068 [Caenorhabditis briggsae]
MFIQFKILSIVFFFFTISFARPNEMLSGVVNTALDTVHNIAETGTGAVQGVVDGVLPAVGSAVQTVGGVAQDAVGMVPELPIGGAQQQPS